MSIKVGDDARMCNCAECGRELLAKEDAWRIKEGMRKMNVVAGRMHGRPYCHTCLTVRRPPPSPATPDDISPYQENAIRDLEDRS